jgi:predicted transcriptional regulator
MARRPRHVKPGTQAPVKVTVMLDPDLVDKIDALAEKLTAEDPYRHERTRTDALRVLVIDGLKHRSDKHSK